MIVASAANCGDGVGIPIQAETPKLSSRADAGARVRDVGAAGAAAIDAGKRMSPDAGARVDAGGHTHDVPETMYCMSVAHWDTNDAASEKDLLDGINQVRGSASVSCGGRRCALPPLRMSDELRCSARRHSVEMALDSSFFKQIGPNGTTPRDRIQMAGLTARTTGESIIPQATSSMNALQELAWMTQMQNGDTQFIDLQFTLVGIGRYADVWTLDFAAP
jgi:uncharacterized protein YkwD